MSQDHQVIPFEGIRIRFEAETSFDQTLDRLLSDVGRLPLNINAIAKRFPTWDAYREEIERHVGPSGFIHFATIDHGAWISKAGINQRMVRVIIGNPLIAITMIRHDLTSGLFAPVELLLIEESTATSLIYVRPSSLMVTDPVNEDLRLAAVELDLKLENLARKVCS